MSVSAIDPLEITALAKIMDELNYYQLLNVAPESSTTDIKRAFHTVSRSFHPDANRGLEGELRYQCGLISKRVTEAYCVLRDARRRKAYDHKISEGDNLRIQLAEARQAHDIQRKAELCGATPQGRQFHGRAETDLKAGNLAGAIQNIKMALTFEGSNTGFKAMLAELHERKKALS